MKMRIQIENDTFEVEVGDLNTRPILATVDGETFEIYPEDLQAAPARSAPQAQAQSTPAPQAAVTPAPAVPPSDCTPHPSAVKAGEKQVCAPIPGVILSVAVKPGDSVEFGQELCVLEAMKMKNAIRASRAGTIAVVNISNGETVKHGQPLMEFAD